MQRNVTHSAYPRFRRVAKALGVAALSASLALLVSSVHVETRLSCPNIPCGVSTPDLDGFFKGLFGRSFLNVSYVQRVHTLFA